MLKTELLKEIILTNKILSAEAFDKEAKEAKAKNIPLEKNLVAKDIISADILYKAISNYFKVPFIELKDQIIRNDILMLIPEPIAQVHKIIAFAKDDKEVKIATLDPEDIQTIEFIKKKNQLPRREGCAPSHAAERRTPRAAVIATASAPSYTWPTQKRAVDAATAKGTGTPISSHAPKEVGAEEKLLPVSRREPEEDRQGDLRRALKSPTVPPGQRA